jgi:hypothetical protein
MPAICNGSINPNHTGFSAHDKFTLKSVEIRWMQGQLEVGVLPHSLQHTEGEATPEFHSGTHVNLQW